VVSEGNQGGEELEDNRGVDEVNLFPYGIRNPIGAGGRGGGAFGEVEPDFLLSEGNGGMVSF